MAIISQNLVQLEEMANEFESTIRKSGLKLNFKKPQFCQTRRWQTLGLRGKKSKGLPNEVVYLGQNIAFKSRIDKESNRRMSQA